MPLRVGTCPPSCPAPRAARMESSRGARGLLCEFTREKHVNRDKPRAELGYWLQCLRVADPFQRVHAAMVLGLMGEQAQAAIPALIDALRDEDVRVRRMITAALGEIGPPSRTGVPVLVHCLRDRNEVVRRRAALALSEMGPAARAAVPGLIAALKDSSLGV